MKVKSLPSVLYRFFAAVAIVALVLAALPAMPAYAADITVNITTDEDAGNANCSLREAIIAANTDTAYNGCTAGAGADVITLTSGSTYVLTLAGAGEDAGATGDLDVTDASGLTINTSSTGTATINAADIDRVLDVLPNASLNLNNLTITNGTAPQGGGMQVAGNSTTSVTGGFFTSNVADGGVTNIGGGIYVNGATLNLASVIISGNRSADDGGGLYITGASTVTISGSTIQDQNSAAINDGAGIYLNTGTLAVSTSTFLGNEASADGGAIYVNGGTLTLNNDTFTNNAADDGGAIYHDTITLLTVTDSTFTSNQAINGDGGAISLVNTGLGSSASISGSTFTSNTAADDGGAIFNSSEPFTITTSVFQNNSISNNLGANPAWGGAITNASTADATKITLSTFANNSVTHTANEDALGGAIRNEGAAFVLANVTFSGNSANETNAGGAGNAQGGALWTLINTTIHNVTLSGNSVSESGAGSSGGGNIFQAGGTVTLANTIVANGLANGVADNCGGTITDGGNNIDFNGGNNCGAGFSNANPNLGALTGTPAYFPLNSGSSAIDTGSNAICATATTTNNQSQNGLTRPVDGDTDGTATCDIGSSEVLDPPPSVTINQANAQADPTNASPINFTVVFSEAVTGFATGDVTLSGTASATTGTVTEITPMNGTTYNVAASGMTSDGTVIASIGAGVATDTGGNGNAASTSTDNTVTYDATAPDTSITGNPSDPSNDSTPTFTFSSSDLTATFECQLDGGGYAACTSGITLGPLADGPHTFEVRAVDSAGNTDLTPDSYTWTIDTTAPNTTINSTPPNPDNDSTPTFTFSSTDLTATFECRLDVGVYAACTSGDTFGPLANGSHTFEVRAVDSAGNADATPASYTWTIDPAACVGCANVDVSIAGNLQESYTVSPSDSVRDSYVGVDNGPVRIESMNNVPIVAGLNEVWKNGDIASSSFQFMAMPSTLLSNKYVFPAYNNVNLDEQLRFGNVGNADTTVTVTIGGDLMGTYLLHPSEQRRVNYAGVDSGPVVVEGSDPNVPIVAAIRDAWFNGTVVESFSQLVGLPSSLLSNKYVFPAYNNVNLNDQLRFGNVGNADTTVTVTIGGNLMGTYLLHPSEQQRVNYPVDNGPVVVEGSDPNVPIIAAIRSAWFNGTVVESWVQLMGLPASQVSHKYLFPAYDNANVDGQLRVGNIGNADTTVTVTIAGNVVDSYLLHPSEQQRVNYPLDTGPVVIEGSDPNVPIIASLRDALFVNNLVESFAQVMGLPASQLSDTFVLPAYNNVNLSEELRFGVP